MAARATRATTRPPAGLAAAGQRLWISVHDDLPEDWELDCRELIVLEAAARQADQNAALEGAMRAGGVIVAGSKGQMRLNAVTTEARQGRIALEKLLSSLALPGDESGEAMTAAERRAQAAARVRHLRAGRARRARNGAA